jgi:DNA adenine methylase
MPTTDSPLRYPGGKTQLAPLVADVLRENELTGGIYAEPFAGGAGLAWRLLLAGKVSEVWLNDIDAGVYALWHCALNDTEALCERIEQAKVTMAEWHRQKVVLESSRPRRLDLAFATLFLNRTNRSGIISGGVIGGKDQTGTYKLDCRFNRTELAEKIRRIALYREVIRVTCIDARLCIRQWAKALPARALMNIDPPYFLKGQDLYTNFYESTDHSDLARAIRKLKCGWMLTYDDCEEIAKLYSGLPLYRKSLLYSAQVKRQAQELLVFAPHLKLPKSIEDLQVAA